MLKSFDNVNVILRLGIFVLFEPFSLNVLCNSRLNILKNIVCKVYLLCVLSFTLYILKGQHRM